MARVFIDGFESGDHDMWDVEGNATAVSSDGLDMDGSYCLDLNSVSEYLGKNITAEDEMYFAFLYRPTNGSNSKSILALLNGGTVIVGIRRNVTTGFLEAYRGGVLINTGSISLQLNVTSLIEIHVKVADSGGRIETKVDGVTDIDFTGDTKPGADTQFNLVRLGFYAASVYVYAYFDNLIMDDAAWIGDTKIQVVVPTGAGTTTGWTPSAGNNWACVDEIPASDVDYVSINSNDVVDTYATGNMAGTIGSVKCVQIQSRARTDGAPTPTNLKLAVRSGGTDYFSGDNAVPATEKSLWNLWENNPADAAAWEESDVNNIEIGIKSAA